MLILSNFLLDAVFQWGQLAIATHLFLPQDLCCWLTLGVFLVLSSKLEKLITESCVLLILIAFALNRSGMEGSPVFSEQAQFIGLLTRPLRQKSIGTEVQV